MALGSWWNGQYWDIGGGLGNFSLWDMLCLQTAGEENCTEGDSSLLAHSIKSLSDASAFVSFEIRGT